MLTVMMPTFVVPVVVEEIVLLEEEDNLNLLVVEEVVLGYLLLSRVRLVSPAFCSYTLSITYMWGLGMGQIDYFP
jgi:hypothetical protein